MKINFLCNYVSGGWKPTDTRLGGTEESIVEWSKELRRRGHEVVVYDNDNRHLYNGGGNICINIKSSEVAPKEPTLYLTNETNASDLDLSKYDAVIWPSEYAAQNIPVDNDRIFILPHGYNHKEIYPAKKNNKQCLYASSPDRGLYTLLQAWPKVYSDHPDAHLFVTYDAPEFDYPGISFLRDVDEEQMNILYRETDIWCHPCNGGELFGITGIKAQAAGCVPVIIPTMALEETVKAGVFTDERNYAQALSDTLGDQMLKDTIREQLSREHYANWEDSTDMLLQIIEKVLR